MASLLLLASALCVHCGPDDRSEGQGNAISLATCDSIEGYPLVEIPAGRFRMGSPLEEPGREGDETLHEVEIAQPYCMGRHEVTQALFEERMGHNPSYFQDCGGDCPVELVRWDEAAQLANAVSAAGRLEECYISNDDAWALVPDCHGYRLPTEAEWERAARADGGSVWACGDDPNCLSARAWHAGNAGGQAHRVEAMEPNEWGLHDMAGNVEEWCQDWYGPYLASGGGSATGPEEGPGRVLRGGSWYSHPLRLRPAYRNWGFEHIETPLAGIRLVRPLFRE